MADQVERVILEADERPAVEGVKKGNAALESFEKRTEQMGRTILRVSDTSRNSLQRMVNSVEKRAAAATASPLEKLAQDRARDLQRAAGDPEAINRITAAYDRLAVAQRNADNSKLLEKAIAGSRRAAAEAEKFERALSKANSAAQAKAREESAREIQRQAAEAEQSVRRLEGISSRLGGIGTQLTAAITLPITAATVAALKFSEQFNKARAALTSMLGSAEQAEIFLGKLEQFALTTPFEFAELIPAAQRMRAFGFEAREIIPILQVVGDATAALGANSETLNRIALALGQIRQKGKVSAEEMRQLAEAGIPAWEILSERIGKSIPEAMKLAEKGAISASEALPAILAGMVQRFNGQMTKQNALLSGQFSNLKDQIGFLLRDIGNILTPIASTVVQFGLSAVGSIRSVIGVFQELPKPLQTATILMLTFAATAGPTALAISQVTRAMALFFGLSAGSGLVGSLSLIRSLPVVFAEISAVVTGGTVVLSAFTTKLLLVAKVVGVVAAAFVGWNIGRWIRDVTGLGDAFDALWEKMGIAARVTKGEIQAQKDLEFANQKLYESLKRRGILVERDGRTQQDWNQVLRQSANQTIVFEDMMKKGTAGVQTNTEAVQANNRAHDYLLEAQRKEVGTLGSIILQYRELVREIGITAKARRDLAEGVQIRLQTEAVKEQRKVSKEQIEAIGNELSVRKAADAQRLKDEISFSDETLRIQQETDRARLDFSTQVAERIRDAQLRSVDGLQAETLRQKLSVEERKLAIEVEYINRTSVLQADRLQREQELELISLDGLLNAKLISEDQFQQRRAAIIEAYGEKGRQLDQEFQNRTRAAQENAANRGAQLIYDNNRRIFENFKRSAEGVLDSIFSRSESVFSAIGNAFKAAILTALKEVVSSQIARFFTSLVTGAQGGGGGQLATAGSGSGVGRSLGLGGLLGGGLFGFPGMAAGGTPPFVAPGTSSAGVSASTAGGFGQYAGFGASAKGLLTRLGNLGRGVTGPGSTGGANGAPGVGGLKGGALLAGGGILAADGLRRGGLTGLAETTAGGALIGFKFGGPIGALIGAGIGAVAGTIRLFIKGAEEKAIEKVKRLYQITIDRKFAAQIVGIAKQQFGGDLDLAIRTPQVKDLLELYAMSRGQSPAGLGNLRPTALSLVQSGSGLFQAPTYQNGSTLPSLGGLPSLGPAPASAFTGPVYLQISVNGEAASQALRGEFGEAALDNPRAVQSAVGTASDLSIDRRAGLSRLIPGMAAG
jgi:tape measure domain-containing protein